MASRWPGTTSRPRRVGGSAHGSATRSGDSSAVLAELAEHLLAAAKQAPPKTERPLGAQLARRTPAEATRLRAGFERSIRIETGRRARRLPYLATGATAAAGYGAWGAAQLATAAAGPAGHTGAVAGTVGLCAAAVGVLRIVYRHGIEATWRRRWWTAGIGAAGWVSAAAELGPTSWAMTAALTAGSAAISARWLRAHEVPDPCAATPQLPLVVEQAPEQDLGEVLADRWATHIGGKDGVVPGALLTGRTDLPCAIRWLVQTQPGKVAFDQLLANRPRIAAGLRQAQTRVILEPVADDESAAWLSVVTRDVLAEGVPYPGPHYLSGTNGHDHGDGRIPIGPYADGTGQAEYCAVDGVGTRNGIATGAPGSGKSAFLEAVALGLKASGRWHVVFGDGDPAGGSSPLLNRLADWPAAGPEEVLAQLVALEELLEVRSALKSTLTAGPDGAPIPITEPTRQVPLREMLPCPAYPGVQWIIDELHRLTTDEALKAVNFAGRLELLTRIGRKYGIVILVGTQSLLVDDFGGNTKLRSYLSDRNCFAFRNPNRTEQHVVAGLRIAPSSLPPGGGYAYSTGTGRVSMLRVAWARDMSSHIPGLPNVELDPDGERVMSSHRPADAGDPVSLFTEASARLRALRTGRAVRTGPLPDPRVQCPDRNGTGPGSNVGGPVRAGLAGIVIPSALTADNVIPIRPQHADSPGPGQPGHPGQTVTDPHPDRATSDQNTAEGLLNDTQRCVYDALSSLGTCPTAALVERTSLRPPAVSKALSRLEALGLATKLGHGAWSSTPRPSDIPPTSANSSRSGAEDKEETG